MENTETLDVVQQGAGFAATTDEQSIRDSVDAAEAFFEDETSFAQSEADIGAVGLAEPAEGLVEEPTIN